MMRRRRISIGNVEVTALSDGYLRFDPGSIFPSIPAESWDPYLDQLTEDGKLQMNVGSYLLMSSGKAILVDTGLGAEETHFEDARSGLLMQDMKKNGIRVEDVDVVMMTHLHSDHVGWNVDRRDDAIRPTFPNARYYVSEADWDLFAPLARAGEVLHVRKHVLPLEEQGVLELFSGEVQLTSEVSTLPTPGHTPGHTSVLISSNGEKGIIAGDATHIPLQAQETDWNPRPDRDPEKSVQSRREIMDRMEKDHGLLIGGHYPEPGFGKLIRINGRRFWQGI